jgi:hypothetical protein
VPRWLEVGISGIPRPREWDLVTVVEVPELEAVELSELAFTVLEGGSVALAAPDRGLAAEVLPRLAHLVGRDLEPPFEVRAVRRGVQDWSVAARETGRELVELPELPGIAELAVALSPDGVRSVLVDGEEAGDGPAVEEASEELERRGRERYPAFVARAARTAAGWELTVDPL